MMTLDDYQDAAASTAVYPGAGTIFGLSYVALKLNGEAGEVAENVGKALRDDRYGQPDPTSTTGEVGLTDSRRQKLLLELSDVLWYVAMTAKELGYSLGFVAQTNLSKLSSRQQRGTLQGSGDFR